MSFDEAYSIGEKLGKGHYSVVYQCQRKADHEAFAVKHIQKNACTTSQLGDVLREVELISEMKGHDHIGGLEDHYESEMDLYIVLELLRGGELFEQIVKRKHYSEADAAVVTHNLLEALAYMHKRGVAHRDLKPENILLRSEGDITDVKIIDFGFAEKVPPNLEKCCGTPLYIAPEVLNCGLFKTGDPYGVGCDMWSLGVIVYILLCGYPPFRGKSTNEQFKTIVRGVYSFPPNRVWGSISDTAKDFVSKLLVSDPSERMTADQALQHPWVSAEEAPDANLEETVTNLIEFNAAQQWRKGIFGVEAITRLRYATACRDLSIKPNSELERIFTEATRSITRLDLSKNYVGSKGLMALLPMLQEKQEIEELILGNNGINNAVMEKLCQVLKKHRGIRSVDLSYNPISHMAGRYLLSALQANPRITSVRLDGTALMESTLKKILEQVQRNQAAASA